MHLSNIKILNKITNKKTTFIKTGIFSAIAACWGVILFGTFTFKYINEDQIRIMVGVIAIIFVFVSFVCIGFFLGR